MTLVLDQLFAQRTPRVPVGGALGYVTAALLGTLTAVTASGQARPLLPERSTAAMAGLTVVTVDDTSAFDAATRPVMRQAVPAPAAPSWDAPSSDVRSLDARPADGAPAVLPVLTPERRNYAYIHETFGPGAFLGSIPSAALAQVLDTPKEWGRGSAGYARRYASAFGAQVVRNSLLYGAGAAFHEDRRYTRLGEGGVGGRVGYALLRTAFVPTTDGRPTLCRSCVVAAVGTGLATSAWYPSRSAGGVVRRAAGFAAGELVGFATGNLLSEFGPDVLHALGRLVHRGPRE